MGQSSSSEAKRSQERTKRENKSSNDWAIVYDNKIVSQNKTINNLRNNEFNRIDFLCNDDNGEALEAIKSNQYGRAFQLYSKSSAMNPQDGNLKINLSYCLYLMARYEESFWNSKQAIDLCPLETKPKAYFRCAEAMVQLKRLEDAIEVYQIVLRLTSIDWHLTHKRIESVKQMIAERDATNAIIVNKKTTEETLPENSGKSKPIAFHSMVETNASVSDSLDKSDRNQSNLELKQKTNHLAEKTVKPKFVRRFDKSESSVSKSSDKIDKSGQNLDMNSKMTAKSQSRQRMTKSYSTERINRMTKSYSTEKINSSKRDSRQNINPIKKYFFSQEDIHQTVKSDDYTIDKSMSGSDIDDIDSSVGIKFKNTNEALNAYTKMISISQTDHRLYINRSYYYYVLGYYEFALNDAKYAISLRPTEPKAYFRAGVAFKALGNLCESEIMFTKVLQLMPNNELVNLELIQIRCKSLRNIGLDEETSLDVALKTRTIQSSYEEVWNRNLTCHTSNSLGKATNLLKLNALKVRNVASETTLSTLYQIFEKFGKVEKLFFDRPNHCCYINYSHDEPPVRAVNALFGYKAERLCHNQQNSWIFGFVPNRQQRHQFELMSKNQMKRIINDCGECEDWRLRDCPLSEKCPFKHIPINKGIETLLCRRPKK